ncbi:MAG: hypothetical protein KDA80_13605, partial [Planctomycetaceae bacterium]|nr:hypothetical protein [Planctomycetaceae bacterium]
MVKARSKDASHSHKPSTDKESHEVEERTQRIGRDLWEQFSRRRPTVFERRWWLDHILEWAMQDESVKVQM